MLELFWLCLHYTYYAFRKTATETLASPLHTERQVCSMCIFLLSIKASNCPSDTFVRNICTGPPWLTHNVYARLVEHNVLGEDSDVLPIAENGVDFFQRYAFCLLDKGVLGEGVELVKMSAGELRRVVVK